MVLGVEPKNPDKMVEIPLPIRERSRPGSLVRSLPTMLLVTSRWPMCSTMTTSDTGIMVRITCQSKEGVTIVGWEKKCALEIASVFTTFII
ncbi:hypothetical protein D3C81_1613110 [compost metagenome]